MNDSQPRDVAALRAESDRLFAEHHALSLEYRGREEAWRAASTEALNAQRAAFAAEDRAWDTYDAAQAKLHANPNDSKVAEAAAQAWTALEAAREAAHAARERATEIIGKAVDESGQVVAKVLQLGEQARAAQDAYFAADGAQHHGDAAMVTGTTEARTADARPEPS